MKWPARAADLEDRFGCIGRQRPEPRAGSADKEDNLVDRHELAACIVTLRNDQGKSRTSIGNGRPDAGFHSTMMTSDTTRARSNGQARQLVARSIRRIQSGVHPSLRP